MAEIAVNNISKSYGIKTVFTDVNFHIDLGDKVGIVGANGAGKTTLFDILSKVQVPDSGEVYIKNNVKVGYMLQNVTISSEKSMFDYMLDEFDHIFEMEDRLNELEDRLKESRDVEVIEKTTLEYNNLLEKFSDKGGYYYESRIEGVLKGLGFDKERFGDSVNSLSGGEKSRLGLGKLMLSNADVLLLDEPTNHLDMEAIAFVEQYLRDFTKIVIIISHDRFFLDKVVNRIFLMENNRLYVYNTNYTQFMKMRAKDLEVAKRAYDNQQKEIERQEEIVNRLSKQGGSLRKRGISQSRSREKLLDRMKRIEKPSYFDDRMSLAFTPKRESGDDVLAVRDLTMGFTEENLFEDISFDIYKGQKVGLIGGNGTGKTTLFKIILNKLRPKSGRADLGVGVFPEYFDQQQSNLSLDKTVIDEIWDDFPSMTHYELRSYLAKFMFIGDDIFKTIDQLSGGERARITLLKLMLSASNFLLMDEPTNHLDIDSKEVLEEALNSYEASAFIISHDRYFLNKVCDRIILLKDKSIEVFEGNYDYYIQKILERQADIEEDVAVNKTQKTKEYKKNKESEKLVRKLKADIRTLENDITDLENKIEELHQSYMDPTIYEDHEKALSVQKQISDLEKEKEVKWELWENLIEESENM
ncbi:MAG: ABC-F family ATP-binding cassette domain-containing protein [Tissierellia bacterium]|nr:ABC-F family ATP-binding cassette domain-containing protein [Tissierellia bacterium]